MGKVVTAEERKVIESKLSSLLNLHDSGISNHWVTGNIVFYANRYHEVTGSYFHRTYVGGHKH